MGLAWGEPYPSQRPGGAGSDPLEQPRDLSGRSVKTPRVRAIHGRTLPGSSGWLMEHDPWLAYQRGRDLALREFSRFEGAFGDTGRLGGKTLDDGATPMMSRDNINSCGGCHNVPWRDMGAGITIAKNSGSGRNTPHIFGGGETEMIGEEIRRQLLAQVDRNGNGCIELSEASGPATVRPTGPDGPVLDFGRFDDADGDGRPDLNPVVFVWYLDARGKRIAWARDLKEPGVAGYGIEVQVFGHGQRDRIGHGGLGSTLRHLGSQAWDMHSGLQAHDPTSSTEPNDDGICGVSLVGARQFFSSFTRDIGAVCTASGISLDDPDRDGVVEEISEGDLDLLEFFLLNHPAPGRQSGWGVEEGQKRFVQIGCTECHVSDWQVNNDRRFFELQVADGKGALRRLPGHGSAMFRGVFSDFRHHDMGEDFCEMQYDGSTMRRFRTTPLWGVGSTAPYGHDGADLSLDSVIRRHGGEAAGSRDAYMALTPPERLELQAFLSSLVLYSTERLPCDINGDGRIDDHFMVAGQDTGREVFNPEWLFRTPGQIEGEVVAADGATVVSHALVNLEKAYGMLLPGLRDENGDGFPDVLQRGPDGKLRAFRAVGR